MSREHCVVSCWQSAFEEAETLHIIVHFRTRVSEAAVLAVRSRPGHFRFTGGNSGRRGALHMFHLRASESRKKENPPSLSSCSSHFLRIHSAAWWHVRKDHASSRHTHSRERSAREGRTSARAGVVVAGFTEEDSRVHVLSNVETSYLYLSNLFGRPSLDRIN